MLKLTSQGLKDLAAVSGSGYIEKRSTTMAVASTAFGVGLVYVGTKQAKAKHNNWWHLLTVGGALNLFGNVPDLIRRASKD